MTDADLHLLTNHSVWPHLQRITAILRRLEDHEPERVDVFLRTVLTWFEQDFRRADPLATEREAAWATDTLERLIWRSAEELRALDAWEPDRSLPC